MSSPSELMLAYYGDDFTGSTDALEYLTRAGAKTALFLDPPTPELLNRYSDLDAIGVAGLTRSLAPAAMEDVLRPAFASLRALGPRHVHYKVCSTFDSSPQVGSIGRAIDIGAQVFETPVVPLVVGAPPLGRYCVFGNLFARMGIGSAGDIYRLDRHPSMSRHPVTPSDESDLRLHLAKQTNKRVGLFDILQLALPEAQARSAFEAIVASGVEVVLFDVLYAEQLARIGALIDAQANQRRPLFSVGSSGIEMALGAYWSEVRTSPAKSNASPDESGEAMSRLQPRTTWSDPGAAGPLLVVSGSCSPVTAGQIDWALANGFTCVSFAPGEDFNAAVSVARTALNSGRNVVVYTSRGGTSERATYPARELGTALGRLARELIGSTVVKRLVIAGGDTSSYAARALGIEAVVMIAPLAPGAPMCRVRAKGSPVDGLEVNFKGGQVGAENYFGAVARGHV